MLKTVSSITNAIGALNYKGTWNASTNSPALTSGVGTKGDYYVVSVAGSTALDGISNWGVGDWAAYNGAAWQRVEGGADLNGVNLSVSGTSTLSGLTASTALALNASKEVVSVTNTGTGNNVLANSPALVTPSLDTSTFAAGTVGAPSLTTTGDTNTGVFFPAADTIALGTGGVEALRSNSSQNVLINATSNAFCTSFTGAGHIVRNPTVTTNTKILEVCGGSDTSVPTLAVFYNANNTAMNAANSTVKIGLMAATSRSINAAGTINALGTDYAEYMTKAGDFTVAKGDVVGINAEGKLTNVFADAISFAVKSTSPAYVGGDVWGTEEALGMSSPQSPTRVLDKTEQRLVSEATETEEAVYETVIIKAGDSDEEWAAKEAPYLADKAVFDAALEAARQKVDRIAFVGQVPVNVLGATPGQYIVPVNDNGAIKGEAVTNPTFEQYKIAVGKVIAIESDGRARVIVKIS